MGGANDYAGICCGGVRGKGAKHTLRNIHKMQTEEEKGGESRREKEERKDL